MDIATLGVPTNFSLINALLFSPRYADVLLRFTFYLLLWVYVTFLWVRCRGGVEKVSPKWRAVTAFAGLCLATFSMALLAFFLVDWSYTGGYRLSYRAELFCTQFGLLTAFLALIASITGKGKLRLGVALISILNLLMWFGAAWTLAEFPRKFESSAIWQKKDQADPVCLWAPANGNRTVETGERERDRLGLDRIALLGGEAAPRLNRNVGC